MTLFAEQPINSPNFEVIPQELKQHLKWMVWRTEPTKKNPNILGKVPYQANGYRGSKNNPEHWMTFEEAKAAYETDNFDGVGIVFNRDDNLVCVDLDDFKDINNIPPEKYNLTLYSYTEFSPSEKGLHIWIRGQKPEWCTTNKNGVEFYGGEKYSFVTVTGNTYHEIPMSVKENQKLIDQIADKYFKEDEKEKTEKRSVASAYTEHPDEIVLKKMFGSKHGKAIEGLFKGSLVGYESHSEADMGLCNHLAYWTNNNPNQMDRLFRGSALFRDKWDEYRGIAKYGQITIEKAIALNQKNEVTKEENKRNEKIDNPYYIYNQQGQLKFNHHLVKDEILSVMPVYRSDIGILRYENGFYKRSNNADIKHVIQTKIKEEATMNRKQEILDLILHENKAIPLSDFNSNHQILNLKNGIYHIPTKKFVQHTPKCYWTIQQPVEYNPNATCPEILEFLHDILDEESVQFVIEWVAYMMLSYTDPDKMLILYGLGGNGKGVLINIIQHLLGFENITNISLRDLEDDKFSRANLYGKLANICGDIDNHAISNTGIIKSLTGGDFVYAQFKGIDGFNFRSFAKMMFSANELPMSRDKTHGWFRRIFILPFEKQIPKEKQLSRSQLDRKLTSPEELSGFLNLVIAAIHKLDQNNYQFTIPESAKNALEDYKFAHDKVEQFIREECVKEKKETLKNFYEMYVCWCRENGNVAEQKRKVKDKLIEKGYTVEKGTGNKDFIFGLSLNIDDKKL